MNEENYKQQKKELYYYLKVVLTVLVVFAHSARMYSGKGVVLPVVSSQSLSLVTEFIYSFHMKLFMAVSGMVYGYGINEYNKYIDSIEFLKKKCQRLIIPYFFFGGVLVAPIMVLCKFTDHSFLGYYYNGIILTNDNRHLWYLVALFEIFVICAITRKWIKLINPIWGLLFCLLVSYLQNRVRFPILSINSCANYLLFFYLGHMFDIYYVKIIRILSNPFTIIIMFASTCCLFQRNGWLISVLLGICGGCFFIGLSGHLYKRTVRYKFFDYLSRNGFGIYIFHPMIIYVLFYFLADLNIFPWILCLAIAIIAFFISLFLTVSIRKLKMCCLIGE